MRALGDGTGDGIGDRPQWRGSRRGAGASRAADSIGRRQPTVPTASVHARHTGASRGCSVAAAHSDGVDRMRERVQRAFVKREARRREEQRLPRGTTQHVTTHACTQWYKCCNTLHTLQRGARWCNTAHVATQYPAGSAPHTAISTAAAAGAAHDERQLDRAGFVGLDLVGIDRQRMADDSRRGLERGVDPIERVRRPARETPLCVASVVQTAALPCCVGMALGRRRTDC
jgi:hypothetical protein